MTLATWIAYLVATILICVSPGPGALSAMSAGMKYGWQRGMWNALGMQASTIVNVIVIALGLGALLMASHTAFEAMKWCGALYLIWLGIQKFREEPVPFEEIAARTEFKDTTARGIFTQGFMVNLTNPKGLVFLLAVLPQFIDPEQPTAMQYLILTLTLNVVDLIVMACYTGLAATVLRLLKDENHIRWTNRGLGSLFVAAGGALAVFKRG
jgi:homoserine/homoserine lactone efflux protein